MLNPNNSIESLTTFIGEGELDEMYLMEQICGVIDENSQTT